jgi:hypothetical protein
MLSGDSITKQLLPGIVKRGEEFVADRSSPTHPNCTPVPFSSSIMGNSKTSTYTKTQIYGLYVLALQHVE